MIKKTLFVLLMVLSASVVVAKDKTPSPEIYVNEGFDEWVIEAYGEGELHLFKDGVEVENPCWIEVTNEEQYIHFEAYAVAEGCYPSDWVECDVYVPAWDEPILPVLPELFLGVTEMDDYVLLEPHINDDGYVLGEVIANGVLLDYPYTLRRYNYDDEIDLMIVFVADGLESLVYSETYVVPALENFIPDVNGDGEVSIGDVAALIDFLLDRHSVQINTINADCCGDGIINISDVAALIDYLLQAQV